MPQKELFIRSSILTNKEKLPHGILHSGKIANDFSPKAFCFYIMEITSPWISSVKVKNTIVSVIEDNFSKSQNIDENFFEILLQKINESLDSLVKKGAKEWLGNLNAVIGIIDDSNIFLSQTGKISGYIFRKGKISTIVEGSRLGSIPHPVKTFSDITAGQLFNEDKVVFGNPELYNHLSLDRIRRYVEQFSPQIVICEFFKFFKKNRISTVNVIVIDVQKRENIENEAIISELPELYFIDEKSDSQLKIIKKRLEPIKNSGKKYLSIARDKIAVHGSALYKKSLHSWQEKISPASKKLIKKSNQSLSKAFNSASTKISPKINQLQSKTKARINFKTINYSKKSPMSVASNITMHYWPKIKLIFAKENRKFLYICLIVLFFGIGYFKVRDNNIHRAEKRDQMDMVDAYNKAEDEFDKTKEDLMLGKISGTAKLLECLESAKKAQESNSVKEKATKLANEIQTKIDELSNTKRITNAIPIFSLNETVSKLALYGNDIYGIDKEGKIYIGNVKDRQIRLVASIGRESGDPVDLSFSESEDKLLIATNKNKVLSFNVLSKTIEDLSVSNPNETWEDTKAISSYSSNIYILNSDSGEVWKHSKGENSYTKGTAYLDTRNFSIRGATDMAIDGNVYILLNTGEVGKFTRGTNQTFTLTGQYQKIEIPSQLFTDEYTNWIFILDKKSNSILRFNKSGEYVNQYIIDSYTIDDFVINGKTQKIWAMNSGQIFEIDF